MKSSIQDQKNLLSTEGEINTAAMSRPGIGLPHLMANPTIYTLGPKGTNCAAAAEWWAKSKEVMASTVLLHDTLEQAFEVLVHKRDGYLLSCAAYPELHTLIFTRLEEMELLDTFIMPTHSMVLASRPSAGDIRHVATHPAPQSLVPSRYIKVFANSNADAAVRCSNGETEACITTSVAAESHGLTVVEDFGEVPMVFMLHALKG
jgi:prephenate dehydratase